MAQQKIKTDDETEKDALQSNGKRVPMLCGTKYPLSIGFVIVNEFCERFSFYGMKAILTLYFTSFLHWDDNLSTAIYHAFTGLAYFTPVFGALIADSWLGKYRTIIYLSLVYVVGHVVKSVGAIPTVGDQQLHMILSMIGLFLIALGTGGIKPCVAAFGGDQFEEENVRERSKFFSIFYLSINAGSLISTFVTPILRADVQCFGGDCYALAFGIPAILMVVALVVFIAGSPMYKKYPPQGNILFEVCQCIGFAMTNRWKNRSRDIAKRDHWLDWAEEKYPKQLIRDIKMVCRVLFLYLPLPMFWALFDQQGSRWTLQATRMNADFGGGFVLQPDQMQTINSILILVFIPIFDLGIYPLTTKCKLNLTPLRRMAVGMVLASLAFVAATLVEIETQKSVIAEPGARESYIQILNLRPDRVTVNLPGYGHDFPLTMESYQDPEKYVKLNLASESEVLTFEIRYGTHNKSCSHSIKSRESYSLVLSQEGSNLHCKLLEDIILKPEKGQARIRILNAHTQDMNVTLGHVDFGMVPANITSSEYQLLERGIYTGRSRIGGTDYTLEAGLIDFGATYTIIAVGPEGSTMVIRKTEDIKANVVHIAWQAPQYILMSAGEVMFSITGVSFSYSQAPATMKAVLQSGWLLTVAFGNVIVIIVAKAAYMSQWAEFLLFAALLLAVCVIFSIMAYFYTYVDSSQFMDEDKEEKETAKPPPPEDIHLTTIDKQTYM
uniref:Solute carrier family 15 member 2 n=1 Tax=Callorhinchus milii TaxID=7868 RepID=V9KDK8_CALMI